MRSRLDKPREERGWSRFALSRAGGGTWSVWGLFTFFNSSPSFFFFGSILVVSVVCVALHLALFFSFPCQLCGDLRATIISIEVTLAWVIVSCRLQDRTIRVQDSSARHSTGFRDVFGALDTPIALPATSPVGQSYTKRINRYRYWCLSVPIPLRILAHAILRCR